MEGRQLLRHAAGAVSHSGTMLAEGLYCSSAAPAVLGCFAVFDAFLTSASLKLVCLFICELRRTSYSALRQTRRVLQGWNGTDLLLPSAG
jgi:hypothetical protein